MPSCSRRVAFEKEDVTDTSEKVGFLSWISAWDFPLYIRYALHQGGSRSSVISSRVALHVLPVILVCVAFHTITSQPKWLRWFTLLATLEFILRPSMASHVLAP